MERARTGEEVSRGECARRKRTRVERVNVRCGAQSLHNNTWSRQLEKFWVLKLLEEEGGGLGSQRTRRTPVGGGGKKVRKGVVTRKLHNPVVPPP